MTIKLVAKASLATIALLSSQSLMQGLTIEAGWAKPSDATPPVKPSNVTPPVKPSNATPLVKPSDVTPPVKPSDVTPPVKPSDVTPPVKPSDATPLVKPSGATPPVLTTFHCVQMGDASYATVARRGDRQTPPMILWRSTLGEYGQYTPQRRCQIVSDKFTRAVALNGGKLGGMSLTYGINNRQRVICHVNHFRESCNSENQLFTLRPSDYGRERQILEQLVNFSAKGSGTPVQQSGEIFYADLGDAIERFFSTKDAQTPTSTPSTQPLSTPKPLVPFKNPTTSKDNSI
ncbi:COP23 domain-containing protein [Pseudanabaena sp. PCC 6802]|uniref:COP23 domain-containing protein n=1 Tax=Pseudanabaena sp. PCC 6802 TaxID=118173 RepID=UPI00036B297A|nr:COP23 domain-containing protein [Pseudanabaena sp. PCC 6802]